MSATLGRREDLTFRANLQATRYGWLRLTPAYSVHLVAELLERHAREDTLVLDPYCGTGTTALVCAERGVACRTTDINPFLVWLTRAKTAAYDSGALDAFGAAAARVAEAIRAGDRVPEWLPALHRIDRWWDEPTLHALGRAMAAIREQDVAPAPGRPGGGRADAARAGPRDGGGPRAGRRPRRRRSAADRVLPCADRPRERELRPPVDVVRHACRGRGAPAGRRPRRPHRRR